MTRWRYHSMVIRDLSICEAKLNAEGEKGWELVSVCLVDANTARVFFKMPVDGGGPSQSAIVSERTPYEEPVLMGQNPFG